MGEITLPPVSQEQNSISIALGAENILLCGAVHRDGRSGIKSTILCGTHSRPSTHVPQVPTKLKQGPHVSPSSLVPSSEKEKKCLRLKFLIQNLKDTNVRSVVLQLIFITAY